MKNEVWLIRSLSLVRDKPVEDLTFLAGTEVNVSSGTAETKVIKLFTVVIY
jgi:hypothetical protein